MCDGYNTGVVIVKAEVREYHQRLSWRCNLVERKGKRSIHELPSTLAYSPKMEATLVDPVASNIY